MSLNAHPVRRAGRWLTLGLLAAALGAPTVRAEGPADPVEAFRQALREAGPARQGPEARAATERLENLAKTLVRPGDLRRALLLDEWPGNDPRQRGFGPGPEVFAPIRDRLAGRLERALASTLKGGAPAAQLAALTMLADMEMQERQPRSGPFPGGFNARPPHFPQRLAPAVLDLLKRAKEPDVRAAAGLTLSRISPDPEVVVPALKQLLADGQGLVERRAGAKALALFALSDREQTSQATAQRSQAVLPVAGKALAADRDPEVRRHCLGAIREASRALAAETPNYDMPAEYQQSPPRPPPGAPLTPRARVQEAEFRKFIEERWQVLLALAQPLNEQAPAVTKALKDADPAVSLAAYQALEAIATARHGLKRLAVTAPPEKPLKDDPLDNVPKAVPPLTEKLTHDNVRIRLAALYVLETLGPDAAPTAGSLVRTLEKDENAFVRWGAARALAAMAPKGGEAAVRGLAARLADDNKDVRYTAALALQRHGPAARPAVKALAQAVERKEDGRLRQLSAQALAAVGPGAREDAAPALRNALSAPEAPVRAAAATALAAVGGATGREGVEALRKALQDPDAQVREAASAALLAEAPPDKDAPIKKLPTEGPKKLPTEGPQPGKPRD
jgi:HEAT repeat protein